MTRWLAVVLASLVLCPSLAHAVPITFELTMTGFGYGFVGPSGSFTLGTDGLSLAGHGFFTLDDSLLEQPATRLDFLEFEVFISGLRLGPTTFFDRTLVVDRDDASLSGSFERLGGAGLASMRFAPLVDQFVRPELITFALAHGMAADEPHAWVWNEHSTSASFQAIGRYTLVPIPQPRALLLLLIGVGVAVGTTRIRRSHAAGASTSIS